MRVALVSREVYPLGGAGIGQFVNAAARLLSTVAEVTVLTTSLFEPTYEAMRATQDPRLPGEDVRFVFVPEPTIDEADAWSHVMHCYSARVYDAIRLAYPSGGPELIEFPDFLGEAFVTLQAAETFDPFLAKTRVAVRIHTTAEICEVLDGFVRRDGQSQAMHAMERFSLARADRVIWQGGDVLGSYERFYGSGSLAPAVEIRYPYLGPTTDPGADAGYGPRAPMRILYLGRLERRKGVHTLVRAATGMDRDDFRLTLVGEDTWTAPLGGSMHEHLIRAIAGDDRIQIVEAMDRDAVATMIREHDAIVIPSLWECWPYAALEALHLNRPVIGTPVGGLVELVEHGVSGWLARGTGETDLRDALNGLANRGEELGELVRNERPSIRGRELGDPGPILAGYQRLASVNRRWSGPPTRARKELPLVSAVIPYYRAARHVDETIDSLLAQSYPRIEIVLVNDGSFDGEDWILAEIAARAPVIVISQLNAGLGAARNIGVLRSTGQYFFPLDADNVAAPEFVERCVEVLQQNPEAAYVTTWSRYMDVEGRHWEGANLGYEPLGNHAETDGEVNIYGDAAAVVRRRIFDAGFRYDEELRSFEDWHFYRELQRAGHIGAVIPERLLHYRVREDSMQARIAQPMRARLLGEIEARLRQNGMRWTSSSG